MPPAIWALLVSIEQYADLSWPKVKGASKDTSRMKAYLTSLHQTAPCSHILTLQNEHATREGIISSFRRHLIENEEIKNGDALIFCFSGHGSRSVAPKGWAVSEVLAKDGERNEDEEPMLEMIIPYDEGTLDAQGQPVCGIPDRTLGILLDLASARHGDNITVVLDACHSGHGTRSSSDEGVNPFQTRGLDPSFVTPLRSDVDDHIYALESPHAQNQQRSARKAFTARRAKSHVLLAACGQHEEALGDDKGGLLTTFLLRALQNPNIHPRTYSEVMKAACKELDKLRAKYPMFIKQRPQCEGVTRDRLVFEDTMADRRLFRCKREAGGACRIEAGEVQGVAVGTVFELYDMSDDLRKSSAGLGTAVAKDVFPTYCLAEMAKGVRLVGTYHTALVLQEAYKLRYSVVDRAEGSKEGRQVLELLETSLAGASVEFASVLTREDPGAQDVDLVLEIDGQDEGGITFCRKDVHLRDLTSSSPRLAASDVQEADFPAILNAIARFNFYLAQDSRVKPYAAEVDLEFHLLEPDPLCDYYDDGPLTSARALQKTILFKNDEAHITDSETDDYAFVLRNNTSTALFPHIIYFDPGTYQIESWYTPFEADKPTLPPYSSLQIGASPEHSQPFTFFVRDGENIDTSFIKVFLLESEASMEFMDQPPVIGCDEEGVSYIKAGTRDSVSEPGIDVPPRKGGWDSLTRKITVVRRD
ncbi:hypothetical protein EIP91_002512 [Steccherinum ochraceum]|uniref:Peptidase C14 caspase domain-containing protein n=1 Tax=Steccherinum ochraceum TaxID=92696 RepID=A0A4R0RNU6_9APHY|nr:hypothetical protein EIP91_002512 [Steccherinum ochraceum]